MKNASREHVIRCAGAVEQPADLARMLDERATVAGPALPSVPPLCVVERGSSLGEAPYNLRQARSTGHRAEAYADRANCE